MANSQVQVANLFETPILVATFPDSDKLNADLKAAILERMKTSQGIERSNVLGWHSDTQMSQWAAEPSLRLVQFLIEVCERYTVDINQGEQPRFAWHPEMWANVSGPGASNQFHTHPGAYWSAVYYVDDGYAGSQDRALGGELVLLDPRMPMINMHAPDLRYRNAAGAAHQIEQFIRPAAGRLVVFPSWLSHAVRPYHGTDKRISVAINLTAIPVQRPDVP